MCSILTSSPFPTSLQMCSAFLGKTLASIALTQTSFLSPFPHLPSINQIYWLSMHSDFSSSYSFLICDHRGLFRIKSELVSLPAWNHLVVPNHNSFKMFTMPPTWCLPNLHPHLMLFHVASYWTAFISFNLQYRALFLRLSLVVFFFLWIIFPVFSFRFQHKPSSSLKPLLTGFCAPTVCS